MRMDESMVSNGLVLVLFGGLFILVIPIALAFFAGALILLSLGLFFPARQEIEPNPDTSSAIGARKNFLSRLRGVRRALPPITGHS